MLDSTLTWIEAHEGLAAWIQGAGTLVALGLTVWTVQHEGARVRRADRAKTEQFIGWIEEASSDITQHFARFQKYDDLPRGALGLGPRNLRTAVNQLLETPIVLWPSARLRQKVDEFNTAFARLLDGGDELLQETPPSASKTAKMAAAGRYALLQNEVAMCADSVWDLCQVIRTNERMPRPQWLEARRGDRSFSTILHMTHVG